MKKYAIKDRITNVMTGETREYFTGKDDYIHDDLYWVDGYTRKSFAEKKIANEIKFLSSMNGGKKIDEQRCIESNIWFHTYEIIEIDCGC